MNSTWKFSLILIFLFSVIAASFAQQDATVVLKNTRRLDGKIIEDVADHMVLTTDIGQVKIQRTDIDRVLYDVKGLDADDNIQGLNDHVIVQMNNGDTFDGLLVAKGSTALIVKTELGRMTVPKQDIKLVEYVSKAYAERGEAVRVKLQNGQNLDGYLYYEDKNSLTLTTKNGRLTLDKENLRSISYNVPVSFARTTAKQEEYLATSFGNPYQFASMQQRQDAFALGYASQFGDDFGSGAQFIYKNRYLLKDFNSLSLDVEADLGFAAFSLNKGVLNDRTIPGAVSASGGSIVTTIGIGTPLHFFPSQEAAYTFFITPLFESHMVYKRLTKEYPSFPTLNSKERDTKIRYGIGAQIGLEWTVATKWEFGLSWNSHFLFKENDFSTIALHASTRLY